jgi:hypothetical protein
MQTLTAPTTRAGETPADRQASIGLRVCCFLLCATSVGALLAKVYAVAPMHLAALLGSLPATLALAFIWVAASRSKRTDLAEVLAIGLVAGMAATLGYDIARVPFHLAGQRIFAPISAFGVWILDADRSSRFTEVAGWTYHYWNGITFAIMYALFMRKRHWAWAVVWACALETLAIVSPFGSIFSLKGNPQAQVVAYLGHVAYGIPLGLMVQRWEATRAYLTNAADFFKWTIALVVCAAAIGPLIAPEWVARDAGASSHALRVEGARLNPDWLKVNRGDDIQINNPETAAALVVVSQTGVTYRVEGGQTTTIRFDEQGIYQLYVQTDRRSKSSFVMVEPVEARR